MDYSKVFLGEGRELGSYDYVRPVMTHFFPSNLPHALILGGGSCTIPIFIAQQYPGAEIHVAELCPRMVEVDKLYFPDVLGLPHSRYHFHNIDAEAFVHRSTLSYAEYFDFIFLDIFVGDVPPNCIFDAFFL